MYRIYYTGRQDMPETRQDEFGHHRTAHGENMADVRMGWDYLHKMGLIFPKYEEELLDFGYTCVGSTFLTDKDKIFQQYQVENMNTVTLNMVNIAKPIHTSMSVGDVLIDFETNQMWFCDNFGWQEVK